jgi:uncharacterized protein YecT (DUF1311 family)
MKCKNMKLFLVLLLILAITACSNIRNSSSSSKASDNNVKVSPSTNLINTNSDNKTENMEDSLSLDSYKEILKNKAKFFSTDNKKKVYLQELLTNKEVFQTTFKVTHFAVLDMDGDKIPEVVLELTVGEYPDFVEVLHYMKGEVYGYIFSNRQLGAIKADGTFQWSSGAPYNGYGKLSFQGNTYESNKLGYLDASKNDNTTLYYINNKQVTEEAYEAFVKEQDGKNDVEWHEFSQKNIETITSTTTENSNQSNRLSQQSKKEEYTAKLDKFASEFKKFDNASASTNDMYQEACKEYKQWDDALNEIYGLLKIQLSTSDMKKLQSEEIQWIKDRDAKAKKDASEMSGGSMEKVLYESSMARSTKERCYVLVDKYIK